MKYLVSFVLFETEKTSGLTPVQEAFLNECSSKTWSVNRQNGLVDVQGGFTCSFKSLTSLPGISFGNVSGYFICSNNQMTSLDGAPQKVRGIFSCAGNQLTSLEGSPHTVNGDFHCFSNRLTSLAGAPQTVGGDFDCSGNQLTSLKGAPQMVKKNFHCYKNQLTSLKGAPQTVGGNFDCSNNKLQSLEGAPHTINGGFRCDEFQLDSGEWNMEGWLRVLNTGKPSAKKLISTLPWLQPDWWNQELQRDPGKTVHLLSTMWKHMPKDMQSPIKIPRGYEDDFDLFSGFDELGLF